LINRADGAEKEVALRVTSLYFAKIAEEDALLSTGASTDGAISLGYLKTQLQKQSLRRPNAWRWDPGERRALARSPFERGTSLPYDPLSHI